MWRGSGCWPEQVSESLGDGSSASGEAVQLASIRGTMVLTDGAWLLGDRVPDTRSRARRSSPPGSGPSESTLIIRRARNASSFAASSGPIADKGSESDIIRRATPRSARRQQVLGQRRRLAAALALIARCNLVAEPATEKKLAAALGPEWPHQTAEA